MSSFLEAADNAILLPEVTKPDQKNRTELLRILTKQKLEKELEEVQKKIEETRYLKSDPNPIFEKIAIHILDKFKSTFWSEYPRTDLKYSMYSLTYLDKRDRVIDIHYNIVNSENGSIISRATLDDVPIPKEFIEEFLSEVKRQQEITDLINSLENQAYDIRSKLSNLPTTIQDISDHITVSEASQEDIDYVNKFIETI